MANANPDGPGKPRIPDEFNNSEGLYKLFREFCGRAFCDGFSTIKELILEVFERLVACLNPQRDDPDECNDEMDKMFERTEQEFDDSARMSQVNECNDEMEKTLQDSNKGSLNYAEEIAHITPNDTNEEKRMKRKFLALIIHFLEDTYNWLRDIVRSGFEEICGFFGYVARKVGEGIV